MPSIPQAFFNFVLLLFSVGDMVCLSGGAVVYGFEQSLDSSLHPPFMVFVTQVGGCERRVEEVDGTDLKQIRI
jgi:hypothetical protein